MRKIKFLCILSSLFLGMTAFGDVYTGNSQRGDDSLYSEYNSDRSVLDHDSDDLGKYNSPDPSKDIDESSDDRYADLKSKSWNSDQNSSKYSDFNSRYNSSRYSDLDYGNSLHNDSYGSSMNSRDRAKMGSASSSSGYAKD